MPPWVRRTCSVIRAARSSTRRATSGSSGASSKACLNTASISECSVSAKGAAATVSVLIRSFSLAGTGAVKLRFGEPHRGFARSRDQPNAVERIRPIRPPVPNADLRHVHVFRKYLRNNTSFYQLATTGGGSSLRGVEYGEFDQVAWVTMKPQGPVIA